MVQSILRSHRQAQHQDSRIFCCPCLRSDSRWYIDGISLLSGTVCQNADWRKAKQFSCCLAHMQPNFAYDHSLLLCHPSIQTDSSLHHGRVKQVLLLLQHNSDHNTCTRSLRGYLPALASMEIHETLESTPKW